MWGIGRELIVPVCYGGRLLGKVRIVVGVQEVVVQPRMTRMVLEVLFDEIAGAQPGSVLRIIGKRRCRGDLCQCVESCRVDVIRIRCVQFALGFLSRLEPCVVVAMTILTRRLRIGEEGLYRRDVSFLSIGRGPGGASRFDGFPTTRESGFARRIP
ncbi:MAG: hypothetical protein ACOCTG_04400 [Bacteroidota bacterium]